MQFFQDSATQKIYAFNDDVTAKNSGGVYSFVAANGAPLTSVPPTLQPCAAPAAPSLTAAQQMAMQAQVILAAGITITSPTLGLAAVTFAAGADVWPLVLSELAALQQSGGTTFADGDTTVHWPDASGALHIFMPAQFSTLAKTLGAFVAGCRNVVIGKPGAALPAASITIA